MREEDAGGRAESTVRWPRALFVHGPPAAWLERARRKGEEALAEAAARGHTPAEAAARRWRDACGAAPEDCGFTLVLPIHDEERSLASVLHALLGAEFPPTVPACVLLVTNACRDRSPALARAFLEALGSPQPRAAALPVDDPGLRAAPRAVRVGAVEFVHVDTDTPGKAHCLDLANAVARARGHRVVLSLDANNWVEPDAVVRLHGDARRHFAADPGGAALLYARPVPAYRRHRGSPYSRMQQRHTGRPGALEDGALTLPGWMMAWDPAWLEEAGGVPHTATEDYALAVLARATGRGVAVSDARVWGWGIATLRDLVRAARRFVRGELQLRARFARDPRLAAQAAQEAIHAAPFRRRWARFARRVRARPARLPVHLVRWMLWEWGLLLGRRDHRRDPDSASWESIGSTK